MAAILARALTHVSVEFSTSQTNLLPRSIDGNNTQPGSGHNGGDENSGEPPLSPAVLTLLAITTVCFIVIMFSLMYTLGGVVALLTTIETPSSTTPAGDQLPPYTDEESDEAATPSSPTLNNTIAVDAARLMEKDVTATIGGTIRHVTRIGGFKARWRGTGVALVYEILGVTLIQLVSSILFFLPTPISLLLASMVSLILLCRIHLTWTHVVISMPSDKSWWRRMPKGNKYWKPLVLPTIIFAIASQALVDIPALVFTACVNAFPQKLMAPETTFELVSTLVFSATACGVTALLMFSFLYLPALVTLNRVEASLLPEDIETIVNFDRTLGGAAMELTESKTINPRALYRAVWRSFDRSSRMRLMKFYAKYYAIILGASVVYMAVILVSALIFGKK